MPSTDVLKQFGLSRNPFTDRTAEKTFLDGSSLYVHSDLQGFRPSGILHVDAYLTMCMHLGNAFNDYHALQRLHTSSLGNEALARRPSECRYALCKGNCISSSSYFMHHYTWSCQCYCSFYLQSTLSKLLTHNYTVRLEYVETCLQMQEAYDEYNDHARSSGKSRGHFIVDLCRPGHLTLCLRNFQERIKCNDDNWDAQFGMPSSAAQGTANGIAFCADDPDTYFPCRGVLDQCRHRGLYSVVHSDPAHGDHD